MYVAPTDGWYTVSREHGLSNGTACTKRVSGATLEIVIPVATSWTGYRDGGAPATFKARADDMMLKPSALQYDTDEGQSRQPSSAGQS